MSDPTYKYYSQGNLAGGLCTEPELQSATKGGPTQFLEAVDVWAPNGVLTRRPGINAINAYEYSGTVPIPVGLSTLRGGFRKPDGTTNLPYVVGSVTYIDASATANSELWLGPYSIASGQLISIPQIIALNCNLNGAQIQALYVQDSTVQIPLTGQELSWGGSISWDGSKTNIRSYFANSDDLVAANGKVWFRITNIPSDVTVPVNDPLNTGAAQVFSYSIRETDIGNLGTGNNPNTVLGACCAVLKSGPVYLSFGETTGTNPGVFLIDRTSLTSPFTSATYIALPTTGLAYAGGPPTFAPVPEQNRVYIGYKNIVYEYRPDLTPSFRVAQVNSLPEIVGVVEGLKSSYNPDFLPQASAYPDCSLVQYFAGLVFMAGSKNNPNIVYWTGPAIDGAVDVIPADSLEVVSNSTDNSAIVGFGTYQQQLFVFKGRSIWQMVPNGQADDTGTYIYTPKMVTSGVGCIAPGSIQTTPIGIIFLAKGGFYLFNGVKTVKLSARIKKVVNAMLPGFIPQITSAHWADEHCYVMLCTTIRPYNPLPGQTGIGPVIAIITYDYQNDSWHFWRSVGVAFAVAPAGNVVTPLPPIFVNDQGDLFIQRFANSYISFNSSQTYDTCPAAFLVASPRVTTQRFGFGESINHQFLECRLRGEIANLSVSVQNTVNDQRYSGTSGDESFIPVNYTLLTATDTIANDQPYSPPDGRKEARVGLNDAGDWASLTLYSTFEPGTVYANGPFTLYGIELGYLIIGRS